MEKLKLLLRDYNIGDDTILDIKDLDKLSVVKPFIKWLVDNDKIEFSKVKEKTGLERELYERMLYWYEETDFLIMLLSVENEPTSFLLSILK